ncbi:MAG: DUF1015 domain-containing protein [Candidatus Omnitrophota bacterium]|nr:DUF1015 domain-containing protein [Candidatus Omnitrophota bacterium]
MARILPFKGILYNKQKVKNLETVVAPPYDVISDRMRDEFYKLSPHNIVKIILGKECSGDNGSNNKYTRAADFLNKWLEEEVLSKDRKAAMYIYEQKYLHKGKVKKRIGFISLMKLEDPADSLVLPHEYTFSEPKEDRLNLIRQTKANTSPIFCIFQDDLSRVTNRLKRYSETRRPIADISFEGAGHKLWRIADCEMIKMIKIEFDKKQVFIADGHHRYETALAFRNEMKARRGKRRRGKFDNIMVYFSSMADESLTILSTYRVIKNIGDIKWSILRKKLSPYFNIENLKSKSEMFKRLERTKKEYTFGVYFKNRRFYLLRLKNESILDDVIKVNKSRHWKRLGITVLHFLIFERILHVDKFSPGNDNIIYTRDDAHAVDLVDNGACEIAFFQLPTKVIQVKNIARDGDRMPQKSTYFYPKLLTGLVLNKLQ